MFPAPLEVDRELYKLDVKHDRYTGNWFPAPREVDRELYQVMILNSITLLNSVSGPSRGR